MGPPGPVTGFPLSLCVCKKKVLLQIQYIELPELRNLYSYSSFLGCLLTCLIHATTYVIPNRSTNLGLSLERSHQTLPKATEVFVFCFKPGYFVAQVIIAMLVRDEYKLVDYSGRATLGNERIVGLVRSEFWHRT
jgi:hypothetical protein